MHPYKYHLSRGITATMIFAFPMMLIIGILTDGYSRTDWVRVLQLVFEAVLCAAAGAFAALMVWWTDRRKFRNDLVKEATRPLGSVPRMLRMLGTFKDKPEPEVVVFRLMKPGVDSAIEYQADHIDGWLLDLKPIDTPPVGAILHVHSTRRQGI